MYSPFNTLMRSLQTSPPYETDIGATDSHAKPKDYFPIRAGTDGTFSRRALIDFETAWKSGHIKLDRFREAAATTTDRTAILKQLVISVRIDKSCSINTFHPKQRIGIRPIFIRKMLCDILAKCV